MVLVESRGGTVMRNSFEGRSRGNIEVVHDMPETASDEQMHVLDDWGTCWCRPWNEVVNRRLRITHVRRAGLA